MNMTAEVKTVEEDSRATATCNQCDFTITLKNIDEIKNLAKFHAKMKNHIVKLSKSTTYIIRNVR